MTSGIRKMKENISLASKVIFQNEKYIFYNRKKTLHHTLCFSQEGEDMILSRLFEGRHLNNFYIDIGAHHPQRFSNTYHFYMQGWCGINIDPLPGSMSKFSDLRPRDINLEYAISDEEKELTYYEFNEPALNGFSLELTNLRDGLHDFRLVGKRKIPTRRLADVLDEHLPQGQQIDFLNVDVEGLDLKVLQSNNWKKYRPGVVLAEDLKRLPLSQIKLSPIVKYLTGQGYTLNSKTINTLIFCRNDY